MMTLERAILLNQPKLNTKEMPKHKPITYMFRATEKSLRSFRSKLMLE